MICIFRYATILCLFNLCITCYSQELLKKTYKTDKNDNTTEKNTMLNKILFDVHKECDDSIAKLPYRSPKEGKELYAAIQQTTSKIYEKWFGNKPDKQRDLFDAILISTKDDEMESRDIVQLLYILAKEGNRKMLIELLSNRCPTYLSMHFTIEELIVVCSKDRIADGTLVLCDAFDKSTNKYAKRNLADAIRRGFKFAGITSEDDKKVIEECRLWYKNNAKSIIVNPDYGMQFCSNIGYQGIFLSKDEVIKRKKEQTHQPNSPY